MQFWVIQTLNSLALGGLLFLLSAGFSLIFGLLRIANLTHGAFFMLGAYLGIAFIQHVIPNLVLASTRSKRVWASGGMSPISSRNNVPPSASSNRPFLRCSAPVNAPFS